MKMAVRAIVTAFVFIACFGSVQRLLMPKYASSAYEGNLIGEYYGEVKAHDVLMIGDCEIYENISPVTLWEEYGITSYLRGSAQQLIWQSYYLLEDALRYEKPQVIVFNVLAMQYDTPQREEYNRLTLDGMRLSAVKLKAVSASMTAEESYLSYIFPLFRYHDRWSALNSEDIQYFWHRPKVGVNGFMLRADVKPAGYIPQPNPLPNYQFGANAYQYLDKITQLCQDNDIELILIKAPALYPYWYPEWDRQMTDYAAENGLRYINFLDNTDEIGIDFETDTYDGGLHLNVYGAEKLAAYFGEILQAEYHLPDRRHEPKTAARWAGKAAVYHRIKAAQEAEFEIKGKIKTILIQE